jgi:hypothetical protein
MKLNNLRWEGYIWKIRRTNKQVYSILVRKSEGKRLLGRLKRSLEGTEIGSKGKGWKELD